MNNKKEFKPEDFGFEGYYETGVECPTWTFSETDELYEWNYIFKLSYNTWYRKNDDNIDVWAILSIPEDDTGRSGTSGNKIYEGLIPSSKFAEELFVNLRMHHLPHVRRELNLDSLLNKN